MEHNDCSRSHVQQNVSNCEPPPGNQCIEWVHGAQRAAVIVLLKDRDHRWVVPSASWPEPKDVCELREHRVCLMQSFRELFLRQSDARLVPREVIADLMTTADNLSHNVFIPRNPAADKKERCVCLVTRENLENLGSSGRIWAVVYCERHERLGCFSEIHTPRVSFRKPSQEPGGRTRQGRAYHKNNCEGYSTEPDFEPGALYERLDHRS